MLALLSNGPGRGRRQRGGRRVREIRLGLFAKMSKIETDFMPEMALRLGTWEATETKGPLRSFLPLEPENMLKTSHLSKVVETENRGGKMSESM